MHETAISTQERVFAYFRDTYGFTADETLADVRLMSVIDSLGVLSLITFLEEAFQVRVETDGLTAENFGTPALVARYVERRLTQAT